MMFMKKLEILLNLYYNYLMSYLFEYNIIFFLFCIFMSLVLFYLSKFFNFQNILKNFSSTSLMSMILLSSILISLFVNILIFWMFMKLYYSSSLNLITNNNIYLNIFYYSIPLSSLWGMKLSLEFFGFMFMILAYMVGFLSFLSLDSSLYWKNMKFIFMCNFLIFMILMFTVVNDLLLLFLFYECMMMPSFLFVYFVSPYSSGMQASLYFLMWTQLGSLLVLMSMSYMVYTTGNSSFNSMSNFIFTYDEIWFLYLLMFLGFGFKVPMWPFQYWLTKTHVEAPAGFSVFLSGFLVKTAIYGFWKMTNEFGMEMDTSFFSVFVIMGVVDASLKMWGQLDLKKLVAYGTVQEMNIIYLAFLWGDAGAFIGGVLFCMTHAFLSSLMFYLVDCMQSSYSTSMVSEISGILHTTPNLGMCMMMMQVLYSGLPGTLKFLSEFYIFSGLISTAPLSTMFLLYSANFLGLMGFSKCWFNVVFGLTLKNQNKIPVDLTHKELFMMFMCFLSMFFFGLGFNCIM